MYVAFLGIYLYLFLNIILCLIYYYKLYYCSSEELILQTDSSAEAGVINWAERFEKENDVNPFIQNVEPEPINIEAINILENNNLPIILDEIHGFPNDEWKENYDKIVSFDSVEHLNAIRFFRVILSSSVNPQIDAIIDVGLVPIFIKFLKDNNNQDLQFEATWVLTNIASGTSAQCGVIMNSEAVPILIQLLRSSNINISEQSAWALCNIAGDCVDNRDKLLNLNVLHELVEIGKEFNLETKLSLVRNFNWLISNLCRGKPQPPLNLINIVIPLLFQFIHMYEDTEVLKDACWTLSYISDGDDSNISSVINSNIVPKLVQIIIESNDSTIISPALRTIGNLVTGNDSNTQVVVDLNIVPELLKLLDFPKKEIKVEAAWTLSNIASGNSSQIQSVIDSNVFPKLVSILDENNNYIDEKLKKEIMWIIANPFQSGTSEQKTYLIHVDGLIRNLIKNLTLIDDEKIKMVILEALEYILNHSIIINEINEVLIIFKSFDYLENYNFQFSNRCSNIFSKIMSIIKSQSNPVIIDDGLKIVDEEEINEVISDFSNINCN